MFVASGWHIIVKCLCLCCFRYQSLVGTVAKKFTKRQHRADVGNGDENDASIDKQDKDYRVLKAKKLKVQKKFLKPDDDLL